MATTKPRSPTPGAPRPGAAPERRRQRHLRPRAALGVHQVHAPCPPPWSSCCAPSPSWSASRRSAPGHGVTASRPSPTPGDGRAGAGHGRRGRHARGQRRHLRPAHHRLPGRAGHELGVRHRHGPLDVRRGARGATRVFLAKALLVAVVSFVGRGRPRCCCTSSSSQPIVEHYGLVQDFDSEDLPAHPAGSARLYLAAGGADRLRARNPAAQLRRRHRLAGRAVLRAADRLRSCIPGDFVADVRRFLPSDGRPTS